MLQPPQPEHVDSFFSASHSLFCCCFTTTPFIQSTQRTQNTQNTQTLKTSVGEVWSGPVPGHFCQTRDRTVRSLMKYLGLGPGPPGTVYIGLVPVQTWSRWSSFSFYFIFSSYNACEGCIPSATQSPLPDVLSSSVCPLHHQPHEMYVSHLGVLPCVSVGGS